MIHKNKWLFYALITTIFWGIWGAFIEIPEKAGFPATLGYSVWAITMIPCSLIALYFAKWKLDADIRSVLLGATAGLLGAGGQLILFQALREGPAYVIFPFISLFPVVTIILSTLLLGEKASRRSWIGIGVAILAIGFLSYQPAGEKNYTNYYWLLLSVIVFLLWGIQAYVMKFSNNTMKAESIFFYMMVTAVLLIPVALWMTDFTREINWGVKGPYLAALIHVLNAVGALTLVYALRYGKAIVVVPLSGLSPLITVVISLIIYGVVPSLILSVGVVFAMFAIYQLSE